MVEADLLVEEEEDAAEAVSMEGDVEVVEAVVASVVVRIHTSSLTKTI